MNPYVVVEKVDNFLFGTYNFISMVVFDTTKYFSGKNKVLIRNKELKKITNNSCIICGNGPSLNEFDFESVKGMPIFTVNYFFNGKAKMPEEPAYHVLVDNAFKEDLGDNQGFDYTKKAYLNHPETKFIFRFDLIDQIKLIDPALSHAYFVNYKNIQYKNHIRCDMSGMMTASHNVVLMALQSAIFMGYKNIYLIGCENNFFTNYTHFYDSRNNNNFKPSTWKGLNYVDLAFKHYDALRVYSDQNGINIYNITPNSYIISFIDMPISEFYKNMKGTK